MIISIEQTGTLNPNIDYRWIQYRPAGTSGSYTSVYDGTLNLSGPQDVMINVKLRHSSSNSESPYGDAYCTVDDFDYHAKGKTGSGTSSNYYYTHYFPLQLSDGYNYSISINSLREGSSSDYYNAYITVTSEAVPVTNSLGSTLIGGSSFEIKTGKTCVNSTVHDITSGRTVINGVDYGINAEYTYPTVEELFADMVVYNTGYLNSSSRGVVSITYDNLPTTGTCYLISSAGNYFGIWKLIYRWPWGARMGGIPGTGLRPRCDSSGGPIQAVDYECYNGSYYYVNWYNASVQYYGGTLAAVQFPHYSDVVVDTVLSDCKCYLLASRDSSSSGTSSTTVKREGVIISTSKQYIDARNAIDWTLLSGSGASSSNGTTLTTTSSYGNKIVIFGTEENLGVEIIISGLGNSTYLKVTIGGVDYTAPATLTLLPDDVINYTISCKYSSSNYAATLNIDGDIRYLNAYTNNIWQISTGTYKVPLKSTVRITFSGYGTQSSPYGLSIISS